MNRPQSHAGLAADADLSPEESTFTLHIVRKVGCLRNEACAPKRTAATAGFTLIELLCVVSVMGVMMSLVIPAFTGVKSGQQTINAAYVVSGVLEQARTYAMSNNTYVYVGIEEVDSAVADTAVPQTPATATKGGRLVMIAAASMDGSNTMGSNLVALQKLQRLEGCHLADFSNSTASTGPMQQRQAITAPYSLGSSASSGSSTFNYPLAGTPQYTFSKVIQFSPQGIATMLNSSGTPHYLEAGLQLTHGDVVPVLPTNLALSSIAAVQIDGITGAAHIYAP